jgi:hypothetical protein
MATWATRDRAEAAEARVKELEARLREARAILRFHNLTATGMTIKCLAGCVACEWLSRPPKEAA